MEVCRDPVLGSIDAGDEFFLRWISEGHNSAYKIWKEHQHFHPISYKNVHKRVQKLLKYALIEEVLVPGGLKHGARNYMLKTRGIAYVVTELLARRDFINLILSHQANVIYRTFLEPYLELRTIKHATYTLSVLLLNYITDCCEITRSCINMAREHYYDEGEIPQEYDLFNAPPFEYMYYKLSSSIQSFILRATILDEEFENWIDYFRNKGWLYRPRPSQGKILCLAKDRDQTQSLLARDKKFMSILRETENKFRIGFNALSDLPH